MPFAFPFFSVVLLVAIAFAFPFFSIVSLWGIYLRHRFSAAGLSAQTIDIDDETTIHFWGPKSKSPNPNPNPNPKPPLVLLHGFGPDAHWQWHQQVAFFAANFTLYIPNLVFFGDSTTKSSERSEEFQAASMGKLMEKLGVKRYYVVGTSYGGYVAYHMASRWPERVEKVVIASSAVNTTRSDNAKFMEKRAKVDKTEELLLPQTGKQMRALLAISGYRGLDYMPDFLLNDIVRTMYSKNRKEKIELLKGLHVGKYDTANISPLPQDVFLVWGERDQLFLLEKATELKGLLGKKTKLEVIKNAGHAPQIENPAEFNKIVYNLLVGSSSTSS